MKRIIFCLILLPIYLGGCSQGSTTPSNSNSANFLYTADSESRTEYAKVADSDTANAAQAITTAADMTMRSTADDPNQQVLKQNISLTQATAAAIDTAPSDRKVIRNAELNLETENPEEAQRQITSIAEIKGGFVVESQQSSSDIKSTSRDIVVMTVRVPSARFSEALGEIRGTASRVVVETVKGQDVTEEFIDVEAQMRAKKALEAQFMEIMKRANTVVEALNVQRQLADVRSEIERIEGRKRFLENQSSLSTIKIRLQTSKVIAATSAGFGTRINDSFAAGFEFAMSFVLGLVTIVVAVLPPSVFIGLPLFLLIRYFVRRQSLPRSITRIAEEEIEGT